MTSSHRLRQRETQRTSSVSDEKTQGTMTPLRSIQDLGILFQLLDQLIVFRAVEEVFHRHMIRVRQFRFRPVG